MPTKAAQGWIFSILVSGYAPRRVPSFPSNTDRLSTASLTDILHGLPEWSGPVDVEFDRRPCGGWDLGGDTTHDVPSSVPPTHKPRTGEDRTGMVLCSSLEPSTEYGVPLGSFLVRIPILQSSPCHATGFGACVGASTCSHIEGTSPWYGCTFCRA
ncbi:hypothetical protein VFPPC_15439 [Pochonia chlamydosporia 170]|uniref:Uncharacterized protein n=1 Tax=Pochonia chlamydosporia 170 TaxID=1380566 RepID=A0A179G9Y0_METCM|nr:hypothetical protein VFPPC_15439 [Pochonia chlamydosporia 170]OAQ74300.1 hypothetical protein VFPPC_15439 [Pochonia chlamydosporia 170]